MTGTASVDGPSLKFSAATNGKRGTWPPKAARALGSRHDKQGEMQHSSHPGCASFGRGRGRCGLLAGCWPLVAAAILGECRTAAIGLQHQIRFTSFTAAHQLATKDLLHWWHVQTHRTRTGCWLSILCTAPPTLRALQCLPRQFVPGPIGSHYAGTTTQIGASLSPLTKSGRFGSCRLAQTEGALLLERCQNTIRQACGPTRRL